ncbi:MAG: DUF2459 domain-containing protein [Synechococcaceae cyanobacterium]
MPPLLLALLGWSLLRATLVPEPRAGLAPLPAPPPDNYTVLVADWGLHTAIVVEQPPGWRLGPPGAEAAPFLEVAWGDRRYFSAADRGPGAVLAALFLPTDSVLFLAGHPDPPLLAGSVRVLERQVDGPTLQALLTSLEGSLRRNPAGGRSTPLPDQGTAGGRFYPAHGSYHWSRNCNLWTVRRLRQAGLARHPAGVLFTAQVPLRLRGFRPRR